MTHLYKLGAVLVAAGLLAVQGFAVEAETQELGVSGDFEFVDSLSLDVTYGYFVTPEWEVKGIVSIDWDDNGSDDVTQFDILGAVDYHFTMLDLEDVLPYAEVAVGYKNSDFGSLGDLEDSDKDAFLLNLGLGVKYFLAENTALNTGIFYEWASEDVFRDEGDAEDYQFVIKLGLNFYF
jgi:hypothetical protein